MSLGYISDNYQQPNGVTHTPKLSICRAKFTDRVWCAKSFRDLESTNTNVYINVCAIITVTKYNKAAEHKTIRRLKFCAIAFRTRFAGTSKVWSRSEVWASLTWHWSHFFSISFLEPRSRRSSLPPLPFRRGLKIALNSNSLSDVLPKSDADSSPDHWDESRMRGKIIVIEAFRFLVGNRTRVVSKSCWSVQMGLARRRIESLVPFVTLKKYHLPLSWIPRGAYFTLLLSLANKGNETYQSPLCEWPSNPNQIWLVKCNSKAWNARFRWY